MTATLFVQPLKLLGHFLVSILHKFQHAKHIFPLMKAGLKEFILSRRARFYSSVIFHTSIEPTTRQSDTARTISMRC